METLTAFFFSGTGNTKYITSYLCKQLSKEWKCTLVPIERARTEALAQSDIVLFAFPIYGSTPPIPVRKFVAKCGELLRGKRVILVETQYFFSGDGAAGLGRLVRTLGGEVIGAEMFNMPNNLSDCKLFPIKNGTEIEATLARARRRADKFARRLLRGSARKRGFSAISRCVGYFSQRKYWRKGEQEKRGRLKIDASRCVGCGLCTKNCPVGNLLIQNRKAKPLGSCVLCYRCVNLCPKRAISLIGSAPPEIQYKGPPEFRS